MVKRLMLNPNADPGQYEQKALRITGFAFYLLTFGLVFTAAFNLYRGHKPETTF